MVEKLYIGIYHEIGRSGLFGGSDISIPLVAKTDAGASSKLYAYIRKREKAKFSQNWEFKYGGVSEVRVDGFNIKLEKIVNKK
jgi:hypothetical protein